MKGRTITLAGLGVAILWLAAWLLSDPIREHPARVETEPSIGATGATPDTTRLPRAEPGEVGSLVERETKLLVVVLGAGGAPLSGAEVRTDDGQVLGETGAAGVATLPWSGVVDLEALTCAAPGHAERRVALDAAESLGEDRRLVVELSGLHRIAGRLLLRSGVGAGSGVAVVAWPAAHPPGPADLQRVLDIAAADAEDAAPGAEDSAGELLPAVGEGDGVAPGHGPWLTRTAADGSFELFVPDDVLHGLTAGGRGFVAARPVSTRPGTDALVIPTLAHYALAVKLVDPEGAVVPQPLNSPRGSRTTHGFQEAPGTTLATTGWRERLLLEAGLEDARRDGLRLVEVVSEHPRPAVGPVHVNGRAPGYHPPQPPSLALEVPRTADEVPVVEILLRPTGEAVGSLHITLRGWEEHTADLHIVEDHVDKLVLTRADGSSSTSCFLRGVYGGDVSVHGIPAGAYTFRLELATVFGHMERSEPIDIRGGATAEVVIDVSTLGRLELDVLDDAMQAFTGRVQLLVDRSDYPASAIYTFEGPPYRAAFLRPGLYRARLGHAEDGTGRTIDGRSGWIDVRPGATAHGVVEFFRDG